LPLELPFFPNLTGFRRTIGSPFRKTLYFHAAASSPTLCAARQKSKQRFGHPTAFKIVQGVEQDSPDDPEAHGAALSHGVEGRVPENVERAVIERN
jgi:hypothetical protein